MIAFTPFQGRYDSVSRFIRLLYEEGVISFIAGTHPARVRFLPPMGVIEERDVVNVCALIEKTMIKYLEAHDHH
jgi:acetylornithine aminotransferase